MPKKILVVEDNLDTRELMHLHLSAEGFAVITASNGREGLYLATAETPDLIVTDISMDEMDGISMIKELRSKDGLKTVPIIALTAYESAELNSAIRAGADRGIRKPTHFDSLVADIHELLNDLA